MFPLPIFHNISSLLPCVLGAGGGNDNILSRVALCEYQYNNSTNIISQHGDYHDHRPRHHHLCPPLLPRPGDQRGRWRHCGRRGEPLLCLAGGGGGVHRPKRTRGGLPGAPPDPRK